MAISGIPPKGPGSIDAVNAAQTAAKADALKPKPFEIPQGVADRVFNAFKTGAATDKAAAKEALELLAEASSPAIKAGLLAMAKDLSRPETELHEGMALAFSAISSRV